MTQFGWDASDYDWSRGSMDLNAARRDGIAFFTHKATEATSVKHTHFGEAMRRARDAGIPLLGAYHVVRSPANAAAEVDYCLAYVNAAAPWWRDFPGWFWQIDLEKWSYDAVPASEGEQFADIIEARTGRKAVIYASRGQYGDALNGTSHELWNANYPSTRAGHFRALYPGDAGAGWVRYSGRMPILWQYADNATIGSQPGCDANAYRGTLDELRAVLAPASVAPHTIDDEESDMQVEVKPGFWDQSTGTGVETLIGTQCFGQGNWTHAGGYLRLKAAGTVQVATWHYDGTGWAYHGLTTLTRDGVNVSWPIPSRDGNGGSVLVQRVRLASDSEATVPVSAFVERIAV